MTQRQFEVMLGMNIVKMRQRESMSRGDVARASNGRLTEGQLSGYENSKVLPSAWKVYVIADAIGCYVRELYEENG